MQHLYLEKQTGLIIDAAKIKSKISMLRQKKWRHLHYMKLLFDRLIFMQCGFHLDFPNGKVR